MMRINGKAKLLCVSLLGLVLSASAFAQANLSVSHEAGGLNLDQAMDLAYKHSFNRQGSEQEQLGSQARQTEIKGSMGPKLSVEASKGWIDTDVNKLAGKTLPTGQRYPDEIAAVGVVISQPLTQLWANKDRLNAEEKLEAASKTQVAVDGNDAKLRGAEAYISALKAVRFLAISRENQQLIDRQKSNASSLRNSGKLSDLDYSRFELAASEANTQVLDAEAQLKVANDNLHEVLGLPSEQALQLKDLGAVAAASPSERAELQSAERKVEALEYQLKAQKVDYWPQVNAFARFSRDYAAKDVDVDFLGFQYHMPKEDFRDQLSYGFNLQWDIWDWGTRSGRAAEIGTQVSRARIARESLASRLRIETSQADAEWERANRVLKDAVIADKLSADILRSFDLKFKNGLATTTDLLTVQRDRLRAQAMLANAVYDVHGALLRKRRAEGAML